MTWHPPISADSITLVVVIALALMGASYFIARRFLNPSSPAGMLTLALRGLALLLLLFFVLQPKMLPPPKKITTKRTLAILVDTSGSMSKPSGGNIGTTPRLDYVRNLIEQNKTIDSVGAIANVAVYGFDVQTTPIKPDALKTLAAAGKGTDLAAAMEQVVRLHQGDDLAGLLIFTDGRNTQGTDPNASATTLKTPIFPVPIGDEIKDTGKPEELKKDLAIEAVAADPRVIIGRTAQVSVSIQALGYPNRQVSVELLEGDKVVSTSAVTTSPQQPKRQAMFLVKPTTVGPHPYRVRIPVEKDEVNPANNESSFSVEVVDPINRLVYLDRLRDERRFIKPILETQRGLRYTTVVQQDASRVRVDGNDDQMKQSAATFSAEQLRGIKAVILGDLPASALSDEQIVTLVDWVDKGGSLLIAAGPASLGEKGLVSTPLEKVMPVDLASGAQYVEKEFKVKLTPEGAAHPAFQKVKINWDAVPALLSRFDVSGIRPAATTLISTASDAKEPVVVSRVYGHGKVAIVLTDSTWRWQLGFDPSQTGGDREASPHNIFWRQLIDWLLPDLKQEGGGGGQVQLITDRTAYDLNDTVTLMASVRSPDGSVVQNATVEFVIASPDGRPIQRSGKLDASQAVGAVYTAAFEAFAPGAYDIQVTAKVGDQTVGTDQVTIQARQPMVEFLNTTPDKLLLRQLAEASGGRVVEPSMLSNIASLANLEPREVEVQASAERDAVSAWDRWWLLAAFIALIAGEWFVRRKNQWV